LGSGSWLGLGYQGGAPGDLWRGMPVRYAPTPTHNPGISLTPPSLNTRNRDHDDTQHTAPNDTASAPTPTSHCS
jgi:hypothetical protein